MVSHLNIHNTLQHSEKKGIIPADFLDQNEQWFYKFTEFIIWNYLKKSFEERRGKFPWSFHVCQFLSSNKLYFLHTLIFTLWTQPPRNSHLMLASDHPQASAYFLLPQGPNIFYNACRNFNCLSPCLGWGKEQIRKPEFPVSIKRAVPLIFHFRNYLPRSMTHCDLSVYTSIKIPWIMVE